MGKIRSRSVAGRAVGLWGMGFGIVGLSLLTQAPAQAPPRGTTLVYPDYSPTAVSLLRNAASHADAGQWSEAIDIYQRVIQQFGETMVPLPRDEPGLAPDDEVRLYVDVRQYCQRRIAALPDEARALYRGRVDGQAERWYRQGEAHRDRSALRRVVEEAFCSSWGDDALVLLGDLAFQDGRFREALAYYRQVVPDEDADTLRLVHPDPDVDLAPVVAKQLLCRAALGEAPPDRDDLGAFSERFPEAAGPFAGRDGPLVQSLSEALAHDGLEPVSLPDARWPTFAGAPTRSKVAPSAVDVGSFQWMVPLETPPLARAQVRRRGGFGGFPAGAEPSNPSPAFHPIIVGDQVVVGDDRQILAFNLNDRPEGSSKTIPWAWRHERQAQYATSPQFAAGLLRYTLTAQGDRIYARMGQPTSGFTGGRGGRPSPSFLVAVDRTTEGKLLWQVASSEIALPKGGAEGQNLGFEGAPVADDRNVYVAVTAGGAETATYVACLDADTGATRWIRYVIVAPPANDPMMMMMPGGVPEVKHRLLTLDGPTLYYQTNLGAVAALDAETGRIRWLTTYPKQDPTGRGPTIQRDLNPAIVHDALVIVAPEDTPRIFAFDAETGQQVWKTEPLPEVQHLLGVAQGRLIATGNHVWSIDVRTGRVVRRWPDSGSGLEGHGRGLLAGEHIYWPTRSEIHILDQASGLQSDRPSIKLRETFQTEGGNLVAGDGYLVIAQDDALVVFCQNSRLIQRYLDELAQSPEQAETHYRLARVAEAVGDDALALSSLDEVLRLARPSEMIDGLSLIATARGHQYRLLMKLADQAESAQDWAQAARRFEAAARAAPSDRDRLVARLRLAEVHQEHGDAKAAVATLQGLLADSRLRRLSVAADARRTVRADLLIAERLGAILREHGRALYDEFDRQAREMFETGLQKAEARLLAEVSQAYPVAEVAPDALLALGRLLAQQDRPSDAAQAFKGLLAMAPDASYRAQALWGLARAYEDQRLWVPARNAYAQVLARFADVPDDAQGTLGERASERLAQEPFQRLLNDGTEPALPMPLARHWDRQWNRAVRPLIAEGIPPSPESSRIFLVEGPTLRAIAPARGETAWSVELDAEPVWVAYLADRALAASPTKLVAVNPETGHRDWQYSLTASTPTDRNVNPFARVDPDTDDASSPSHLHGFRIVGNRVYCLRGVRELLALDGDTGLVEWSYAPTSGSLNPHYWVGVRDVVLQLRDPNAILVLDASSGRSRAEHGQSPDEDAWVRDPVPIDDDRVALVTNLRTVALFDLKTGSYAWSFRESDVPPRYGPPRLVGDAERLLVLHDGVELIRLDLRTGEKLWARNLGPENLSERPDAWTMDGQRFYYASGQTLGAIALADGSVLWKRKLIGPSSGWRVQLTDQCVAAFPGPKPGHGPNHRGSLDGLPVLLCARDSGDLVQRLHVRAPISDLAVRLAPQGLLIATQGGLWALGDRPAMDDTPAAR